MACYHNNSLILNEGTDLMRTTNAEPLQLIQDQAGSRDVYKIVNIFHDFGDASQSNK